MAFLQKYVMSSRLPSGSEKFMSSVSVNGSEWEILIHLDPAVSKFQVLRTAQDVALLALQESSSSVWNKGFSCKNFYHCFMIAFMRGR